MGQRPVRFSGADDVRERAMARAVFASAGCGLAATVLAGCIALPIPLGEGRVTQGREIGPEQSAVVAIGGTSRDVLLARLGEPQAVWEERNILVYAWDRVHMAVLVLIAGPVTAAGALFDVPTHQLLLVQLDEAGVVRRAERCVRPLHEGFGHFLRAWADGRPCD